MDQSNLEKADRRSAAERKAKLAARKAARRAELPGFQARADERFDDGFLARLGGAQAAKTRTRLLNRIRAFAKVRPFIATLTVSAVIFGLYFFVIAAPLYVSTAQFSIRGKEGGNSSGLLASLALPGGGGGGVAESIAVSEYIRSHDILNSLDTRLQLRKIYSKFRLDPFAVLSRDASPESFLKFYRGHIRLQLDREANITTLTVESYDPQSAHAMAEQIMELSEAFVNDISGRVREATLSEARRVVEFSRQSLSDLRDSLAEFRNRTGQLDPTQAGAGIAQQLMALQGDVVRQQAKLDSMLTVVQADSPKVKEARAQIESLQQQIKEYRDALASTNVNDTLAKDLKEYERLLTERTYAEQRMQAALASLDQARLLANQRERFVVRIVDPNIPSTPTRPRRIAMFLLSMTLVTIGYGIVYFAIAGVRDHEGVV